MQLQGNTIAPPHTALPLQEARQARGLALELRVTQHTVIENDRGSVRGDNVGVVVKWK